MDADISALSINVESGIRMPIIYPGMTDPLVDEAGNEGYLELLSKDSAPGRKFFRKLQNTAVKKMWRSGGRLKGLDDEDAVEIEVDKLVVLMTGWHLVTPDGKAINTPFNEANVRKVMSLDGMAWLREAALAFADNAANFTKASSAS